MAAVANFLPVSPLDVAEMSRSYRCRSPLVGFPPYSGPALTEKPGQSMRAQLNRLRNAQVNTSVSGIKRSAEEFRAGTSNELIGGPILGKAILPSGLLTRGLLFESMA